METGELGASRHDDPNINKAESLLDANVAKSLVSSLLILTDDWGV